MLWTTITVYLTMPEAQSRLQCTTKANAQSEGSETSPTAKRGRRLPPSPLGHHQGNRKMIWLQ